MRLSPRKAAKVTIQPTVVACRLTPIESKANCALPQSAAMQDSELLHLVKAYVQSYVETTLASTNIFTTKSLTGGGALSNDLILQLVNDELAPGSFEYYGTDGSGVKGFHVLPAGGSIQYQDEGSNLGPAISVDTLNFVGPLITASRIGNTINVTSDILVDAFNVPL